MRNTGKHRHLGSSNEHPSLAALKDGLFCAETASATWSVIYVVTLRLFSSCEAFLS